MLGWFTSSCLGKLFEQVCIITFKIISQIYRKIKKR